MTRLAIFDCDGTLVDSGGAIAEALRLTFDQFGLAAPERHVGQRVIGLSLIEAMAQLVPDATAAELEALAAAYKAHFVTMRTAGRVAEPLYPGILELLDSLEGDGWMLAVATGKSDRGLRHCLTKHGIHARFVSLQTSDRHPSKPHPSMIETALAECGASRVSSMMIGDTSYDMAMGVNAGVIPVGVDWGYHHRDELVIAGARHVAIRPSEILDFARETIDG